MSAQAHVPAWLQIVWAVAGIAVAVGGFFWIVGIFWPYLKWSKKMMRDSYDLGIRTATVLTEVQREIRPLVDDARAVLGNVKEMLGDDLRGKLDRVTGALERIAKSLEMPESRALADLEALELETRNRPPVVRKPDPML